ncbi:hypothetical protein OBV_25920 [Oscillibacter valericigenes Sjm18-20]|nr:hypothetical protein OBV_25920 [Oscillibacter valericigenes Sjm18-20]
MYLPPKPGTLAEVNKRIALSIYFYDHERMQLKMGVDSVNGAIPPKAQYLLLRGFHTAYTIWNPLM